MLELIANPSNSSDSFWSSSNFGVVIGGSLALLGSTVLFALEALRQQRERRRRTLAAARICRDDVRAAQTQIAKAVRRGTWWHARDRAPQLASRDDLSQLASAIKDFEKWGIVTDARRQLILLDQLLDDGEPFDVRRASRAFLKLEESREVLSTTVDDDFRPHEAAVEMGTVFRASSNQPSTH